MISKLQALLRATPESTEEFIGVSYSEYLRFIERFVPREEWNEAIAQDIEQFASSSKPWSNLGRLIAKLWQPNLQQQQRYEVAVAPPLSGEQSLSLIDQYLLLLYFLHQNSLSALSEKLGVGQTAILAAYFDTSEAVVNALLCDCSPLLNQLTAGNLLKLDQEKILCKLQSATTYAHDAQQRLRLLQTLGFSPSCIFDIGGSNGSWTRVVHEVFPSAHYHLFEPLAPFSPRYQQGLELTKQQTNCTIHPYALGQETGTVTIAITPDLVGSSILVEHQSEYFPTSQQIPLTTVDAVIQEHALPCPQLIKMDTQGYELSILKGAIHTLKHVEVLAIESWLVRGYGEKTPLLMELTAWLAQHNFSLFDIGGGYRDASGVLIAPDCFFVNQSSPLMRDRKNRIVNFDWVM